MTIDEEGFQAAMEEQRVKARTAREVTNYMGADATVYDEIDVNVTTEFVGYDHLTYDSEITVLTTEKEIVDFSDGRPERNCICKRRLHSTLPWVDRKVIRGVIDTSKR